MGNLSPDASLPMQGIRQVRTRARNNLAGAVSPFARLRLFRNPFGELTRQERSELARVTVQPYLDWLASGRVALQFVGPCGHGKTSHLLAIERELPNSAYVYYPEDGTQPSLAPIRPLLIDEAQRLGWRRRWQLLRGSGPLVLSTHIDLSNMLMRAGFKVWTVDLSQHVPASQLQTILNSRIAASAVQNNESDASGSSALTLELDEVVALQQRFGSNIRRIEQHLYDAFQRLAETSEPWLPAK